MISRLVPKSEFSRNVLTLMTGTALSQSIPILISPILTRFYSPEDFGVFAQYMAIVLLLVILSTGRYEMAVMLPSDDDDALNIMALVFMIILVVNAIAFFLVLLLKTQICNFFGIHSISKWLVMIPMSTLLAGAYQCLNYWCNRQRNYKRLAATRLMQSSGVAAGQLSIGFGSGGPLGLIFGSIIGQLTAVISLTHFTSKSVKGKINPLSLPRIKMLATKYKKFPFYQVPSTFIETMSSQLPVILLGVFFGPAIVGFFSMSQRVVRTPIMIVGGSVADVFRQRASKKYAESGDLRNDFIGTLKRLLLISALPGVVFFVIAPELFAFIFGESWREAGEYARILTPMFLLSFVVSPLSIMFMVAEKQEYDLVIQLFLVSFSAIALTAGHYLFKSPKYSLGMFTMVYCVKYCIELYLSYTFCKVREKH